MKDVFSVFFAGAVLLLVVLVSASLIGRAECSARWGDSGLKYRYGLLGGCQIQKKGTTEWIPEDSLRNVAE